MQEVVNFSIQQRKMAEDMKVYNVQTNENIRDAFIEFIGQAL